MTAVEFIPLTAYPSYEISSTFPFIIRNRTTHRIMSQSMNNVGYLSVSLNGATRFVHRIVAQQFIGNNIEGRDVNHINGNRLDNRVENLEVITHSENLAARRRFNKQPSVYVKRIESDDVVQLRTYDNYTFERYFFDRQHQILYLYQERKDRYKRINPTTNGRNLIVSLIPSDHPDHPITRGYAKLVRYMNAIN